MSHLCRYFVNVVDDGTPNKTFPSDLCQMPFGFDYACLTVHLAHFSSLINRFNLCLWI